MFQRASIETDYKIKPRCVGRHHWDCLYVPGAQGGQDALGHLEVRTT